MILTLLVLSFVIIMALFLQSYIGSRTVTSDEVLSNLSNSMGVNGVEVVNGTGVDNGADRNIASVMSAPSFMPATMGSDVMIDQQMATPIPACALNTDEKFPLQGVMYEYGGIPDGSSTVAQYDANIPCKPFAVRPGIAYFPATEHMGDKASESNGIMGFGGQFQPVDMCKKLHCTGCGKCAYVENAPVKDTDDIRRNYPALIDRLRAARTDEYPFLKL